MLIPQNMIFWLLLGIPTYIYNQIMPHHTKSMLPNIRGYPRSSIKWNQFATSDGMLLMFTRHFQHWWHWWQCLSLSASDISDGKSQEWVRQIWLTHYIFFMRLVAENSLNYMHISEINFMSTWFIYTQFCNWHMFKWSYLMRTTLFVCSLGSLSWESMQHYNAGVSQLCHCIE